jgi:hypothetical protein
MHIPTRDAPAAGLSNDVSVGRIAHLSASVSGEISATQASGH